MINLKKIAPLFLSAILFCAACKNGNDTNTNNHDSSPMGPAPDNNAANNPSLADTMNDKTNTMNTETMHLQDTMHK